MKRTAVTCLALALLLSGCAGRGQRMQLPAPPAPPVQTAGERDVSESYRFKQIHTAWADTLGRVQGSNWFHGYGQAPNADHWSKTNQVIYLWTYDTPCTWSVTFSKARYSADTKLVYGTPKVLHDALENEAGKFELVDNTGGTTDVEHSVDETFTREKSVESTVSEEFSADLTVGAKTTAKVGGDAEGGSFETELSVVFGTHFGTAKSETDSESTSESQTISDTVVVPPGHKVMLTFATKNITQEYPFEVDGVVDFNIQLHVPDRRCGLAWFPAFTAHVANEGNIGWRNADIGTAHFKHWGCVHCNATYSFSFESMDDFGDFIDGTNTDWPHMEGWYDSLSDAHYSYGGYTKQQVDQLMAVGIRTIKLTGTQQRQADSAVTMTVQDVTECNGDALNAIEDKLNQKYDIDDPTTHGLDDHPCVSAAEAPRVYEAN